MMERYLEIWGAYAEGGVEALLPYVTEDTVWEEYRGAPGAQAWRGKQGVLGVNRRWQEDFDDFGFEPTGEPQVLGADTISIPVRVRGTGKGSGIDVDWDLHMVTTFRDGMVAHLYLVDSIEEARARVS